MKSIENTPQMNYNSIDMIDNEMLDMLKEYSEGSPEILADIIESFEPEASVLIVDLKSAIVAQDVAKLKAGAHSLSGISGSIGAARLKAICSDVENNIKQGNNQNAFILADSIFPVYSELIEILSQM